jgi:hypothetical protein
VCFEEQKHTLLLVDSPLDICITQASADVDSERSVSPGLDGESAMRSIDDVLLDLASLPWATHGSEDPFEADWAACQAQCKKCRMSQRMDAINHK